MLTDISLIEYIMEYNKIKKLINEPNYIFNIGILGEFKKENDKFNLFELPKNNDNIYAYVYKKDNENETINSLQIKLFFHFELMDFFYKTIKNKNTASNYFEYLKLRSSRYSDEDISKKLYTIKSKERYKVKTLKEDFSQKLSEYLSKNFNIEETLTPKTIIDKFIDKYSEYLNVF